MVTVELEVGPESQELGNPSLTALAKDVFKSLSVSPETRQLCWEAKAEGVWIETHLDFELGSITLSRLSPSELSLSVSELYTPVFEVGFNEKEVTFIELGNAHVGGGFSLNLGGGKVDLGAFEGLLLKREQLGWTRDREIVIQLLEWVTRCAKKGEIQPHPKFVFDSDVFGIFSR